MEKSGSIPVDRIGEICFTRLFKKMQYLVTTRKEVIPAMAIQVVMLDGTVPGWNRRPQDLHFDHHREGGEDIQIKEMKNAPNVWEQDTLAITTQVDADACCAAAWLQLLPSVREKNYRKLAAIAYDCDHLTVPPELSDLSDFASQAVAALKASSDAVVTELGLPKDRKNWSIEMKERYASEAFKRGTEWLIESCKGERKWPGESGEAEDYWKAVESNTQMLIKEGRLSVYKDCLLFDGKGLGGKYIDPRCWLKAAVQLNLNIFSAITLVQREVIVENEFKGYSYTIGCVPLHPMLAALDYTQGVFEALTAKEQEINSSADGWGGRKTVGGSGWNTPSQLTPEQVIDTVLLARGKKLA